MDDGYDALLALLKVMPDVSEYFADYTVKSAVNNDKDAPVKFEDLLRIEEPPKKIPKKIFKKEPIWPVAEDPLHSYKEEKDNAGAEEIMKRILKARYEEKAEVEALKRLKEAESVTEDSEPLDLAAAEVAKRLKETEESFMLVSPMQLTVYRNGKFSKEAHVGSEDFKPLSAYAGKRGEIILTFKPVMATNYIHMEMSMPEAKKHLSGFREYAAENLADCMAPIQEAKEKIAEKKREAEIKEKSETYKEKGIGWGDW